LKGGQAAFLPRLKSGASSRDNCEQEVNETCKQLVARMIVNTMAGRQAQTKKLHEEYFRERYLHVPVEEVLRAKREASA